MDFEKIEQAYHLLLENVQQLQSDLATDTYDALIEQNVYYTSGEGHLAKLDDNNKKIKALNLSAEEWRRAFQFLLIKAQQMEQLQANHQFTPDTIGFILLYVMEALCQGKKLDMIEIGSGTGNLAETLVINSQKTIDYLGLEVDDLLIDLSASIAEVIGSDLHFIQEDAVRPQLLKKSDVLVSDLPVGYYPDDVIASRYEVASKSEHTYAHHLLLEQGMKYLKDDGIALFLAPNDLLTSPQSELLKNWLTDKANVLAIITLPEGLFQSQSRAKTLYVLSNTGRKVEEAFVYPLTDVTDAQVLRH